MLRTSVAIATLGCVLASGAAALPAQAQRAERTAARVGHRRAVPLTARSLRPIPQPLAASANVAFALARERWLRSRALGEVGVAAIGDAGIGAPDLGAGT